MHALMEQKLTARNLPRLLRLVPRLSAAVDTSMSEPELFGLLNVLREMRPAAIRGSTVPVRDGGNSRVYRSFLVPSECNELLLQLEEHLDSGPPAPCRAEVRNGSGLEGAAADAAERLANKRFTITLTENWDSFDVRTTQVRYKRGALHTAEWVTQILGCGEAVQETDSLEFYERNAPLRIVLGADYAARASAVGSHADADDAAAGAGST
jgi:hypothetical protein